MAEQDFSTMGGKQLQTRLATEQPNNDHPDQGFALVYVLDPQSFNSAHIPGSINIPRGSEEVFEQRFSKQKEIIVYSYSPECDASPKVRQDLLERGFINIHNYGGGLTHWKASGYPVARIDA